MVTSPKEMKNENKRPLCTALCPVSPPSLPDWIFRGTRMRMTRMMMDCLSGGVALVSYEHIHFHFHPPSIAIAVAIATAMLLRWDLIRETGRSHLTTSSTNIHTHFPLSCRVKCPAYFQVEIVPQAQSVADVRPSLMSVLFLFPYPSNASVHLSN